MTKAQVEAQIHKISKMTPDEAAAYRSTVSTSSASDQVKNWLWRSSVTDRLALSGALGNKARQAAVNRHHATACEEHF